MILSKLTSLAKSLSVIVTENRKIHETYNQTLFDQTENFTKFKMNNNQCRIKIVDDTIPISTKIQISFSF